MKSLFSVLLVAAACTATAKTVVEVKTASAPRSDKKTLSTCPKIDSVEIKTQKGSIAASGLTIKAEGQAIPFDVMQPSHECISDMVCDTYDNFQIMKAGFASVRRNNDGNYPTRDLPGHNLLVIDGNNINDVWTTCVYDLK